MDKIKLKTSKPVNPALKNLGILMFNYFAKFFNLFIILVCVIVLVAGYWWLIKPKYDFIATNQELTFREREYENKVEYLKQLGEIKNLYKSISQADKDKIDIILAWRQDVDRLKIALLRQVDKVGKEKGVTVDNIVITPLDNSFEKLIKINEPFKQNGLSDKLKLMQITFDVNNLSYAQLKQFLNRLEISLTIMDVTKLIFDPGTKQAKIELVTYYLES
jgi:hypothetical protein